MNLYHLRVFQTVAEHEHITRASEELILSQPAVTKIIQSLEHEIGLELIERHGRRIVLPMPDTCCIPMPGACLRWNARWRRPWRCCEMLSRERVHLQLIRRPVSICFPQSWRGFAPSIPRLACILPYSTRTRS